MRVREYVTRESMELFVRGQESKYSDVQCLLSIAARVGARRRREDVERRLVGVGRRGT